MALWPAGFDPFVGLDPFSGFGTAPGGGAGLLTPSPFFDPFWSPAGGYAPGTSAVSRRRLNAPGEAGAGAEGQMVPGGEQGDRRTREPYTVGSAGWTRSIPCDFIERDKEYVVRADIPGCKKSEIHVEVHDGNVLRFGHNPLAEREKEDVDETGIFHRAERVTTFRNRNLRMPDDADMSAELQATYEDGVLTVVIPKKSGATRPEGRAIQIA
ncbi:hypothetical protein D9Q98_005994 [Chlorella vulgaris]|uniref:SHSP domain-containing protein n=1 Tax=Chlorella vulgaris TaxID=3077 RepID=A0A9D4TWS9_CHLVU|nr:hypothetical protein D9Q98_005994 [Chlorella vulgaris]